MTAATCITDVNEIRHIGLLFVARYAAASNRLTAITPEKIRNDEKRRQEEPPL